jgi:hypothetical protein
MQRWSRTTRWALHGGMGALAGAGVALVLRHPSLAPVRDPAPETPRQPARALVTVGAAAVVASVVAGTSRGGEAVDSWMERRLAARGVRRPRVWLGVAAAGASLAMSASDRRRAKRRAAEAQTSPGSVGGGGAPGDEG